MLKLREFDLQFAFPRAGALREDVENQRRAVEDFAVENLFEIAALRRRKLVIENHGIHVLTLAKIREFTRLALADERGGIKRVHFLQAVADDFTAGGHREFTKFGERVARIHVIARFKFDTNEKNPFRPLLSGFDEGFQLLR